MTTTQTPPAAPEPQRDDWNPEEQRKAYTRLLLVIAGVVFGSIALGVTKTVAVVVALLVMIMLHEFGHFITAKWAGMKVTEYFLGFGPRLWSVRRGETEYGIKAIPAGGYVKIIGMSNLEEVPAEDESRTYRQKGYWRRLSVAVAGSTMHFIIAFVLLWSMFVFVGTPNDDNLQPVVSQISALETGPSPAAEAGFRIGDRILAVDGVAAKDWETVQKHIQARPGTPVRFDVERGDERLVLTPTPIDLSKVKVKDVPAASEPRGFVGISPTTPIERAGPVEGLGEAGSGLWRFTTTTVGALGDMFSADGVRSYTDELSGRGDSDGANRFLSPVGFVRIAGQAADSGVRDVLILLVAINVFVGMFNMIPLLPFDGGHVAVATYEAVRSRKGRRYFVDGRKALAMAYPVVFLLILIAVTSLYIDIARPMSNPFR